MFLSNLREVVTLLAKVLPQVCPAASLEGKTGLKVFTEPTQTTVYKYFLFNFLLQLREAVKYYFADFVRKGRAAVVPPKSVTPFSLKKIRKEGEGGTPQIRNSFFAKKNP